MKGKFHFVLLITPKILCKRNLLKMNDCNIFEGEKEGKDHNESIICSLINMQGRKDGCCYQVSATQADSPTTVVFNIIVLSHMELFKLKFN